MYYYSIFQVNLGVQYALNIETDAAEMSELTVYRYLDWSDCSCTVSA